MHVHQHAEDILRRVQPAERQDAGNPDDDFDKSYFAGGEIDVGGDDGGDDFHEL